MSNVHMRTQLDEQVRAALKTLKIPDWGIIAQTEAFVPTTVTATTLPAFVCAIARLLTDGFILDYATAEYIDNEFYQIDVLGKLAHSV